MLKLFEQFGRDVTKEAKRLLKTRKITSTGKLEKSLKYEAEETSVEISMEDYGVLRDSGQLGKKRKILKRWNDSIFISGKGFTNKRPPVDKIGKWIKDKPLKYTPKTLNSQAFLISRKIQMEGIQPGLFFSDAFNKYYPEFEKKLAPEAGNYLEDKIQI